MDATLGDFGLLTHKITTDRGFGCASYKEKCLRRRIAVRMRARGVHTYDAYARLLDEDAGEYDRLLDALTINVTKLFRNWEAYEALARRVVPELMARDGGPIRVWSAGCASGHEPHSLAILFHRHAAEHGAPKPAARVHVLGTDIDRSCLAAAQRGQYIEADFADTPPELRERYFTSAAPFTVSPEIRAMVRFEYRDLLAARLERESCDLLVCRNVLIYFDRDTQIRLFDAFHEALAPGGYLMLGKVETLLGASRGRFAAVDARERIFARK